RKRGLGSCKTIWMTAIAGMSGLVSLRTHRAGVDPGAHQFAGLRLRARCGLAAFARRPAPGHQIVLGEMFVQQVKRAAAVAVRVLDLLADLPDRFALPGEFARRKLPARVARDALVGRAGADQREILLGVARRAGHA